MNFATRFKLALHGVKIASCSAIHPRTMQDRSSSNFASNLRLACSYVGSIAEVCRKLGLNRPQFNRYLSGASRPAAHTLRRLGDFFGIETYEWWLEPTQFARLLNVRPQKEPVRTGPVVARDPGDTFGVLQGLARNSVLPMERYLGAWFEYYHSMSSPGHILRSLVLVWRHGDESVRYRRMERLARLDSRTGVPRCSYRGTAIFLNERIFFVDYEQLTGNELSQTILFPSYKNRLGRLAGLKLGVSAAGGHEPVAVRTVLEFLGPRIDVRKALQQCGLLQKNDPSLDAELLERINNREGEPSPLNVGHPY